MLVNIQTQASGTGTKEKTESYSPHFLEITPINIMHPVDFFVPNTFSSCDSSKGRTSKHKAVNCLKTQENDAPKHYRLVYPARDGASSINSTKVLVIIVLLL